MTCPPCSTPCQPVMETSIALKQQGLPNYAFSLLLAAPEPLSRLPLQVCKEHQAKREELRPLRVQKHRVCLESRLSLLYFPFNLPISIFSTASCTVTPGEDTVFTKGYRLHTTTLRIEGENWVTQQEIEVSNWAWQAQDITSDFMVVSLRSGTSIESCGQEWCSAQGQVMVQCIKTFK